MEGTSPFEVLGVPMDADDVAIKRAYMKKVREHPPESDPAGFQKVCEAFEQLRDPAQRARIAEGLTQPELRLLQNQYVEAMRAQDLATAQQRLEEIVSRFPDFKPGYDELVAFLQAQERSQLALEHAERFAARFPNDVEPYLLVASVQMGSYEYVKARAAIDRARELAPQDRRPLVALSRMYRQMERGNEAAQALSVALALPDRRYVADHEIIGRRILMHAELHMLESARSEIQALATAATTDDQRRETSSLLTSLSGFVLANGNVGRISLADEMFTLAQQLDPARHRFVMGKKVESLVERLPAATQKHVDAMRAEKPDRLLQLSHPFPWKRVIAAAAAVMVGLMLTDTIVQYGSIALGVITAAVLGISAARQLGRRPYDYLEIRPLTLVRVQGARVLAVPLMRIRQFLRIAPGAFELRLDDGETVLINTSGPGLEFFEAAAGQLDRITKLAASDVLDTELDNETLVWVAA